MLQKYDESDSTGFVEVTLNSQHPEMLSVETITRNVPTTSRLLVNAELVANALFADNEIKSVDAMVLDSDLRELDKGVIYSITDDGRHIVPQVNSSAAACRAAILLDNGKPARGFDVKREVISEIDALYVSLANSGIKCKRVEENFNSVDDQVNIQQQLKLIAQHANVGDGVFITGAVILQTTQVVDKKPEPAFFIVDAIDFTMHTACIREPGFSWAITVELDALVRHLDENKIVLIAVETSK